MNDIELMVRGCLTIGPLEGTQLKAMLSGVSDADLSRALKQLRAREQIVFLDSGRWALVHRA